MTSSVGMKSRKLRTTVEIGSAARGNWNPLIIDAPERIAPVPPVMHLPVNPKKNTPTTRKPRKFVNYLEKSAE